MSELEQQVFALELLLSLRLATDDPQTRAWMAEVVTTVPPDVSDVERRIRALRRDVQRDRQDLADELDFRLNEETQRVEEEIYEVVRNFARENGYDLILPGPALFASDTINLTDDLLARLRSEADQAPPSEQP